jgi:hypothetical protein
MLGWHLCRVVSALNICTAFSKCQQTFDVELICCNADAIRYRKQAAAIVLCCDISNHSTSSVEAAKPRDRSLEYSCVDTVVACLHIAACNHSRLVELVPIHRPTIDKQALLATVASTKVLPSQVI